MSKARRDFLVLGQRTLNAYARDLLAHPGQRWSACPDRWAGVAEVAAQALRPAFPRRRDLWEVVGCRRS